MNNSERILQRLGLFKELEPKVLMEVAAEQVDSTDFGTPDFTEPLRCLLNSAHSDARLNSIGRLALQTYLLQLLTNRLKLELDRKRWPAIAREAVSRPIFIIGLPRTGSTLLYELLGLEPGFRVPASWEVMYPSPPPGSGRAGDRIRILRAALALKSVDYIAPEFKKIHEIGARLPQECIAIQTHAFMSIQFHTTNRLNGYQHWLEEKADWTDSYVYHRKLLQQLQCHSPSVQKRWLLKAPGHLYSMDALNAIYPDAVFIQTHRDPLSIIPSIASHCVSLRQAFSESVDVAEIGHFWAYSWCRALDRGLDFRRRQPANKPRFHDVFYREFIADPLREVERIYGFLGLELTTEKKKRIQDYLKAKPQYRHGRHRYALKDFELRDKDIRELYSGYMEEFAISSEAEDTESH